MAVVAQNGLDPNDPENQSNALGGSGTVLNSATPGASADGGGGSNAPAQRANPSGAPNVQDYLNANQGAGQRLAGGITNDIQNQANRINQNVTSNQNQLNNLYQPLNQNISQGQQTSQTAFQNPQALLDAYNAQKTGQPLSADQQSAYDQYNQFQANVGGTAQNQQQQSNLQQYGSQGQTDYSQLQNQLLGLNQVTSAPVNQMGQQQLLQRAFGTPTYNPGQQTLDSLFLQGQGNNLRQNLGNIYNQTNQNVTGLNSDVNRKLSALQALSGQNITNTKNLFTGGLNDISTNVGNEYSAAQDAQTQYQRGLQQDMANGRVSNDVYQQLGISPGTHLWGVGAPNIAGGVGGLFNQNGIVTNNALQAANAGGNAQVATPEEYARYNALNQLAGGPAGSLQSSIFGGGGNQPTQGGYSPFTLNNEALQNQINSAKNQITGTQSGSDFYNSLMGGGEYGGGVLPALLAYAPQNLPGFGGYDFLHDVNTPNLTGGGGFHAKDPGPMVDWGGIGKTLKTQLDNGTLTPDQAKDMVDAFVNNPNNIAINGSSGQAGLQATFKPFLDYYSNVYSPAVTDIVGNPIQTPNSGPMHGGPRQPIHLNQGE